MRPSVTPANFGAVRGRYLAVMGVFAASACVAACAGLSGLDGLVVDACFNGCDAAAADGHIPDGASDGQDARAGDGAVQDGDAHDPGLDAASGPTIHCGSTPCSGSELCCIRPVGQPAPMCATGCNPTKDIAIGCDTPDDCPGMVCCASGAADGGIDRTACAAACSPRLTMCDPAAAAQCPGAAPTCVAANLSGYYHCGP